MAAKFIRKPYGPAKKVAIEFPEQTRTKQSFQAECDINNIMKKYQLTGALEHTNKHQMQYGDATPLQLQDALDIVIKADEMFDSLPSSLRKKFHGDPAEYLEFVQDEDNEEEMRELGLLNPRDPPKKVEKEPPENEPEPEPGE